MNWAGRPSHTWPIRSGRIAGHEAQRWNRPVQLLPVQIPRQNAYTEAKLDNSPYNRVLKQAGVGEDINNSLARGKFEFAGTEVAQWKINGNKLEKNGTYPDKSLMKYTITNQETTR